MNNEKRNQKIFELHEGGKPYSQLAIQFNLSPARIKQIYKNEKDRVDAEIAHLDALNGKIPYTFLDALREVCETENQVTRIFGCLYRAGIIAKLDKNYDVLDTYSNETLLRIRNFGPISLIFTRRANVLYKERRNNYGNS